MNTRLTSLRQQLLARQARPTDDWLAQCVRNVQHDCADAALLDTVWQRFLRLPLASTSAPVLPPDALHAHKVMLQACVLELASVDEIGYSRQRVLDACIGELRPGGVRQPRELLENEDGDDGGVDGGTSMRRPGGATDFSDNHVEEAKGLPRGTLKLTLTDGHQAIYGLEHERISALDVRMPIGSKASIILILGAEIRRGVALLRASSVRVLCSSGNTESSANSENTNGQAVEAANNSGEISKEELALRLQMELNRISDASVAGAQQSR
ncbi:hypothetical protein THASP1DRAFT_30284 [Thamnocephalis sphaerospora]|uniref:RecQ-mediated genome instability protein 1 n=1 Tax=Thamnocephalis sphaerospora TaxID=78915 RepID=A0A4P9XPI7_9FUNG|nr:hypothetical protein THASP1DRAFT_30284 [Thamnocephalis sphaerospora]|eukprot:RKP07906.1 hypothetical protein THASP1DRAFT_30284 [Thamnocephalis sphaerospora]